MKELIEFIEAMEAPTDYSDLRMAYNCGWCEFETFKDGDFNNPENHTPDCPYRKLKELVAKYREPNRSR